MSPLEVLRGFISSMYQWETTFHSLKRTEDYKNSTERKNDIDANQKATLEGIFERYLTKKAKETIAKSRLEILITGRPAEYEQIINDQSVEEGKDCITIEANRPKGFKERLRYTLRLEGQGFKIDAVHQWKESTKKWSRVTAI